VHVPDADVPFVEPGDTATIVIDALPGKRFPATVSRVAGAEDPGTRTMRVEIDLRNEHGLFHDGMYGRATICLDDELSSLNVPSSFVVEKTEAGVGSLFVLRDGIARKTRVRLGEDDARRTVILNGLQASDWLIAPGPDVTDGTRVTITKRDGDRKEP
jgi:multidrug efflux pump subunit AcrA (membrane-fusion protein)